MKKNNVFRILMLICCLSLPAFCFAQPDPPCDTCPIDGGLSFLLAAGVGYGVKKYRDGKRKEQGEAVKV